VKRELKEEKAKAKLAAQAAPTKNIDDWSDK